MSTLITPSAPTLSIPAKLAKAQGILRVKVYERKAEIHTMFLAMVAKRHHLQFGKPGIAKTMLVDELVKLVSGLEGDGYFHWQLSPFTTPPELVGAVSLIGLKNDVHRYNTAGKLPVAKVAFLDEFFKGNSAVLNFLLSIMNEGVFFNDGAPTKVPLTTIFAGSNELPREAGLAALYDRVTFKHNTQAPREDGSYEGMLKAEARRMLVQSQQEAVVSWDEILIAQQVAACIPVPDLVISKLIELKNALAAKGVEITPRRINQCISIIQADAYLNEQPVADLDNMRDLCHVLWMDPKDEALVKKLVLEHSNPIDKEAVEVIETVEKLAADLDIIIGSTTSKKDRQDKGLELHEKLERAEEDLLRLQKEAKQSPRRVEMIEDGLVRLASVTQRLLKEAYGISE